MILQNFIINTQTKLIDEWERLHQLNNEAATCFSLIIDSTEDLKNLRKAIKNNYIDLRCINYPDDLIGTKHAMKYIVETIDKTTENKEVITREIRYAEVWINYNWYHRNKIYECDKLQISIDQNKNPNIWWLSPKGEKLLVGILDVIFYKIENEAFYRIILYFCKILAIGLALLALFIK
jgi:hypothetical protein